MSPNGAGRYGRRGFDGDLTVGDLSSVQDTVNTILLDCTSWCTNGGAWLGYPRIRKFVDIITSS